MKLKSQLAVVVLAVLLGCMVCSVQAAEIQWIGPIPFDVPALTGPVVEAVNVGGDAVMVGDVNFVAGPGEYTNIGDVMKSIWYPGGTQCDVNDPNMNIVLQACMYHWAAGQDTGGAVDIVLSNLTPGETYRIQLYGADARSCCGDPTYTYADDMNNVSSVWRRGNQESVIGVFMADANEQTIVWQHDITAGSNNDPIMNAIVLSLEEPVPVEVTWDAPFEVVSVDDLVLDGSLVHAGSWGQADSNALEVIVGNEVILFNGTTDPELSINDGNGVNADVTCGGQNNNPDYFMGDTGSDAFNQVMQSFAWDGPNPKVLTLNGLIPGNDYVLQLFVSDDRGCCSGRTQMWGDDPNSVEGTQSDVFSHLDSAATIGMFTATGTRAQVYGFGVDQDQQLLNAYQLRMILPEENAWTSEDIGEVEAVGSSDITDGVFTIAGAGNIWGPDAFHYVYQKVEGDFVIEAQLDELENVDQWTKGGLMVSNTPGPLAANAYVYGAPDWGVMMQARLADAAEETAWLGTTPQTPLVTPVLLKLTKIGNDVTGEFSIDNGVTWTVENTTTVEFGVDVYAGMAVAVTGPTEENPTATAVFSNVSITPVAP